jgi:hypothetical protein
LLCNQSVLHIQFLIVSIHVLYRQLDLLSTFLQIFQ